MATKQYDSCYTQKAGVDPSGTRHNTQQVKALALMNASCYHGGNPGTSTLIKWGPSEVKPCSGVNLKGKLCRGR